MNTITSDNSAFPRYASSIGAGSGEVIPLPQTSGRAALHRHSTAEWSTALGERFNAVTSLPRGWDGYTGRPVSFTCARFAAQLLERLYDGEVPPPSLVPGSDGTLQIEWHINQYDIEIDVLAPFNAFARRYDCLAERGEEIEVEADISALATWITDLKLARVEQRIEAA